MSFTENKAFKQRSPYAIFEDEVCRADTMRSLISDKELNYLKRNQFIGALELHIIRIVTQFKLINAKQLYDLLCLQYKNITKYQLDVSIKKLCNKSFLHRIVMSRKDVCTLRYVYAIGIHAHTVFPEAVFSTDVLCMDIHRLKRTLATNQLVISALKECGPFNFSSSGIKLLKDKGMTRLFSYDSLLHIDDMSYYALVLRKVPDWEKNFCDSLELIGILTREEVCKIVAVCEDSEQSDTASMHITDLNDYVIVVYDRELHLNGFKSCVEKNK